jgi:hypothetical protein
VLGLDRPWAVFGEPLELPVPENLQYREPRFFTQIDSIPGFTDVYSPNRFHKLLFGIVRPDIRRAKLSPLDRWWSLSLDKPEGG